MKFFAARLSALISAFLVVLLAGCSTPTLVEVARRRLGEKKDDVTAKYKVTDADVVNFTDEVQRKLANRSNFHMGVRYGAAGTQATLGTLAGAAQTFGWSTSAASGLGLGATYIFGMGQIFDSKAHAQAYEQASEAIKSAEAAFYFKQLQMGFTTDATGKKIADAKQGTTSDDIPSSTYLSPAGETLYYRTTKILKVLDDTLMSKIPDLEDLKEANGEPSSSGSPALPKTSDQSPTPPPSPGYTGPISSTTVRITATPAPARDLRKLANQIHRDANKLDDTPPAHGSQSMIDAAGSYTELTQELNAYPPGTGEPARDHLNDLIEKAVTDKNGAVELKAWRAIVPAHPVATPAPAAPPPAALPGAGN
ncbi:MAG TPA: hypothetical protein VGL72_15120 [Bryobacteraceae bacterium]